MEAQLKIREEAREQQDILADLARWQSTTTKRPTRSSSAARPTGPAVPGRQSGLAPLRGQRNGVNGIQPAAASQILRETANRAQAKQGTAAKHTYDYFKDKWDKFDYDAAMADNDDENGSIMQAAAQQQAQKAVEMQHEQKNWRKPNAPVLNKVRQHPSTEAGPSDAELWKDRGNKAFTQGAYADAKTNYTQSIALESTCLAYANRAMAELKLKEFATAEADCTQALQLDPSYTKAYLRRASALKEMGKLLEAAEDYEMALRLEPTSKATAADRRACLDLFYQQEHLQHELPRMLLTTSTQQQPAAMQSPSPPQPDRQPANVQNQAAAQVAAPATAQQPKKGQQAAHPSTRPQQAGTPSTSARQDASKHKQQPASTEPPPHVKQAAQPQGTLPQSFGRRGAPSCVIEELPADEPAVEPALSARHTQDSRPVPASSTTRHSQKSQVQQQVSDPGLRRTSGQGSSSASASASGSSTRPTGGPSTMPEATQRSQPQTAAALRQQEPALVSHAAPPTNSINQTAVPSALGTSAAHADGQADHGTGATESCGHAANQQSVSATSSSNTEQATAAKDRSSAAKFASAQPAATLSALPGAVTARQSTQSETGLGQEQASQQPPEVAANNGMNGGATHAQKPTGTAAKAAAHAQQPQLNGHASAATSPAAVGAAQASSSGLLDDRLKSSIPPPRSGTEFEVSWKRLRGCDEAKEAYIRQLDPMQLPKIFKQSLTPAALCGIATVALGLVLSQNDDLGVQLLKNLKLVPRFDMVVLSLSRRDKEILQGGFDAAAKAPVLDSMVAERLAAMKQSYRL